MRATVAFVGAILVSMTAAAGVSHAAPATVLKDKFSGTQAATSFQISQSITCAGGGTGSVFAFGFVAGADSITTMTGSPKANGSNGTFVEIDSYSNTCTGTNFGSAAGAISNGYVPPDSNLTSARATGTGLIQDFGTAIQYSVTLNLTFTGIGPLNDSKSHTMSRTISAAGKPLTMSNSHFENTHRAAMLSGTVTLEGFALTPIFFFGSLVSNDNSELTVTK
jgi:hypothetical protein